MDDEAIVQFIARCVAVLAAGVAWGGLSTLHGSRAENVINTAQDLEKFIMDAVPIDG